VVRRMEEKGAALPAPDVKSCTRRCIPPLATMSRAPASLSDCFHKSSAACFCSGVRGSRQEIRREVGGGEGGGGGEGAWPA
jgi:hypothetical protein